MARALVVETELDVRGFVASTLRAAGWEVTVAEGERPKPDELDGADAIVSDLGAAVRNGWLGAHGRPRAKLIVSSSVSSFLEDVREQVDAVLPTPTTTDRILAAVEDAPGDLAIHAARLARPSRIGAVGERGLRMAQNDPELRAIAELSARATSAGVALLTLVDAQQQVLLGHTELSPELVAAGGAPKLWSFSRCAMDVDAPVAIADARTVQELGSSPLVSGGLVRAVAGVPIDLPEVGPVGSVTVTSSEVGAFGDSALAALQLAARLAAERLERIAVAHPIRIVSTPRAPPPLRPGDLIDGKYLVTAALGEGGQAKVYLARDRLLGQLVAIKIQLASADPSVLHEAKALAQLRHKSIVQLYGWGRLPNGAIYLVLEYVQGITLHARLSGLRRRRDQMGMREVLEITHAIAGALATLHAIGLLHGDVKPANIMVDLALSRALLIDFGLGVHIDGRATMSGGTYGWSAPEQLDVEHPPIAGPSLDAYSLACVAYAMVTGHGPFEGTRDEQLARQRRGDVGSVCDARDDVPAAVDEVFATALSGDPARRFNSPIGFAEALDAANAERSSFLPRASLALISGAAVPESRGIVFRSIRRSLTMLVGPAEEARVYAALSPDARRVFEQVDDDDGLYPTTAYRDYVDAFVGEDQGRLARLATLVANAISHDALHEMKISRTPETLLHVMTDIVHRYHEWGETTVRRLGSHAVELRLTTPKTLAPVICRFFGAIIGASVTAMGRHTSVVQTACVAEGAPACLFDVRWASR